MTGPYGYYTGYQPPYFQQPQMQQPQMAGTQMSSPNQPPQVMTPPTIRAEIIQVDGEEAALQYPVGAGSSQMMIAKDESAIYIKTAYANAQPTLDVYVKRPPAPAKPAFDPSEYLRKDEFETRLAAFLALREKGGAE